MEINPEAGITVVAVVLVEILDPKTAENIAKGLFDGTKRPAQLEPLDPEQT